MQASAYDLLVVGGGINGCGIARDAAGRGLAVCLVEMGDLASATSSASSKLIHGGLRYLEHYEFRLVREALQERERLLTIAPHIAWPLAFVLPHLPGMRPQWLLRAGLFLYDHLAPRGRLPGSRRIDLRTHPAGHPLADGLETGFVYADCWVDDSRLVVLNAVDAKRRGATIETRCRLTALDHAAGVWRASVIDKAGDRRTIEARVVVNAAGPWVGPVLTMAGITNRPPPVRLIKGSHIVVPRVDEGAFAYVAQQPDKRIVFILPYEDRFTLIGTTDVPYEDDPSSVAIDPSEVTYLCQAASRLLRKPVHPGDVVWTYSGVRPLFDDGSESASAVTRDYVLDLATSERHPPFLSVFGGKITTYRRLAEHALETLAAVLPIKSGWTGDAALPGGDFPRGDVDAFRQDLAAGHPWLPAELVARYARSYGTACARIIGSARSLADLGPDLGCGLYGREVDYLVAEEFAVSAADILWRRSKLGLRGGVELEQRVSAYLGG